MPKDIFVYVNGVSVINATLSDITSSRTPLKTISLNGFSGARILYSFVYIHTVAFDGIQIYASYKGTPLPTATVLYDFDLSDMLGINNGQIIELCDVRRNFARQIADGTNAINIDGIDNECEWASTGVDKFGMQKRYF